MLYSLNAGGTAEIRRSNVRGGEKTEGNDREERLGRGRDDWGAVGQGGK